MHCNLIKSKNRYSRGLLTEIKLSLVKLSIILRLKRPESFHTNTPIYIIGPSSGLCPSKKIKISI